MVDEPARPHQRRWGARLGDSQAKGLALVMHGGRQLPQSRDIAAYPPVRRGTRRPDGRHRRPRAALGHAIERGVRDRSRSRVSGCSRLARGHRAVATPDRNCGENRRGAMPSRSRGASDQQARNRTQRARAGLFVSASGAAAAPRRSCRQGHADVADGTDRRCCAPNLGSRSWPR